MVLAACDDNGNFALAGADDQDPQFLPPANAVGQSPERGVDIERPDIFAITDNGLWDGRPSLGGVWVAHPEVTDPERVVIRNTESGREIVGALFRRERENPGPLLQVSSHAAEGLGLLPGAPTRLEVVVLRRDETQAIAAQNPVIADLQAPVGVAQTPLAPADASAVDGVAAATEASAALAGAGATAAAVTLPPALEAAVDAATPAAPPDTATAAPPAPVDVSAVLAPDADAAPQPQVINGTAQIGIYSVQTNADDAAQNILAAGIPATVTPQQVGGRTVWRVLAGPLADPNDITRLRQLGFVDAFILPTEPTDQ